MSLARPGVRVATSRTMSFTEVLDLCPRTPARRPVPAAGHDWRRRDGAAAPRGPREGPAACEPRCDCGARREDDAIPSWVQHMIEELATKMVEIAEQNPKEESINAIMRRDVSSVIVRRSETNRCGAECNAHYRDPYKYPGESAERVSLVRESSQQQEQNGRQKDVKMFLHAE